MSAADLVAALFFGVMRFDPKRPDHPQSDRFVLSKGHAAPLLYAAWAEAGAFPVENLLDLRKIDSDLEGHPTPRLPFVDVATGSLGQGLSAGAGMAINAKYLDKVGYRVYVLMGDGEVAEGAVWEGAQFASHYKLDNLCAIVDVNRLGQSQATMSGHDIGVLTRRFEAFGWHAIGIDGHSFPEIQKALDEAAATKDRPTAIVAKTYKGKGVSFLEDQDGLHGKPLASQEEVDRALAELALDEGISLPVKADLPDPLPYPAVGQLGPPSYGPDDAVATRKAYGNALARLGEIDPRVVALDGDTKNSTFSETFMKAHPDRFFEGYIAEQNIVGAGVGLGTRGKIPFVSTFAAFFTRAYDQIRMAAISRSNVKMAGSHAGVSIGEDGPSQMALEDLAMMRAIPGCTVLYPSDAVSAEACVKLAAEQNGMFFIRTSRPDMPVLYPNDEAFEPGQCKVIREGEDDRVTVVGAGVTLLEALKAHDLLKEEGIAIRVVDVFSVKPVDAAGLKQAAAATDGQVITVEDHYAEGGIGEAVQGALDGSGATVRKLAVTGVPRSGKPDELLAKFGIDAGSIVSAVKEMIA
jgi:transketolase